MLPFLHSTRVPLINVDTSKLAELATYKFIDTNQEFVGFEHARRYFSARNSLGKPLNEHDLIGMLGKNKRIVGKANVGEPIRNIFNPATFTILRKIKRMYPLYAQTVDEVMNGTYVYPHNMFFMRGSDFDKYRRWLFSIIDNEFPRLDDDKALSHFGETLLTIYCKQNFKDTTVKCHISCWSHDLSHLVNPINGVGDE